MMISRFLKNVFIPERIDTYYVVPKRVVGFDITKTEIYATQLYFSAKKITIEKCLHEPLVLDATKSYAERVTQTLETLKGRLDSYDEVRSSLSSSLAVLKELKFPFADYKKIKAIIHYEIEASLPFPVNQAFIDFIVTNQTPEQTTLIAAAVKKEFIAEHIAFFNNAGITLNAITLDMFDVYSFYKQFYGSLNTQAQVAIICISFASTTIAFISNNQLKSIRSIPKGLLYISKLLGQTLNLPLSQALEEFLRFGLSTNTNPEYDKAAHAAFADYWSEIQFTLDVFTNKQEQPAPLNHIYLLSKGSIINNITEFISTTSSAACTIFDTHDLLKQQTIKSSQKTPIPHENLVSLCTAFDGYLMQHFNLAQDEYTPSALPTFYKQVSAMVTLLLLPFLILIGFSYWQEYRLARQVKASEREIINYLREQKLSESNFLQEAISQAEEHVNKEAEIWFAFSSQTRFSFLKYLEQLSSAIDRKSIGLNLRRLIITYDSIILDGEVAGFNELKVFERELRQSQLFVDIPSLQSIKFPRLELKLKKNSEEIT